MGEASSNPASVRLTGQRPHYLASSQQTALIEGRQVKSTPRTVLVECRRVKIAMNSRPALAAVPGARTEGVAESGSERAKRDAHKSVLAFSAELAKVRSAGETFALALQCLADITKATGAILVTHNHGIFASKDSDSSICVHAQLGDLDERRRIVTMDAPALAHLDRTIGAGHPLLIPGWVGLPFQTNGTPRGAVLLRTTYDVDPVLDACSRLIRRVIRAVENIRLDERATYDPLTEACTRSYGLQRLGEILRFGTPRARPTTILLFDLDQAGALRQEHGDPGVDRLLQAASQGIRRCVRRTDTLVRFGRHTFMLILPNTDAPSGTVIAERIRRHLHAAMIRVETTRVRAEVSVGVAQADPADPRGQAVLDNAQGALFEAREQGGNRTVRAELLDELGQQRTH